MIKKFFTLLIFTFFSVAVVFTSGCSSPIGGLQVDSGTEAAALNYIRAAPILSLYDQGNWFRPEKDVKVFGVFGGVEDPNPINIDKLKFKIINDPGLTTENEDPVDDNRVGIPLNKKGVKTVVISYSGMVARYPIVVGENGTSGWVDQDGSGIGIDFIWQQ